MDALQRDLERALAAGDERARPALAAAYLRQGRLLEALDVVDGGPFAPDLRDVEAAGWERLLPRLRPAVRVPGLRPYRRLCGWLGSWRAVLADDEGGLVGVFDLRAGEVVLHAPRGLSPLTVSAWGLLCEKSWGVDPTWYPPAGPPQTLTLPGFVREADPDRPRLVIGDQRRVRRDTRHWIYDVERHEPLDGFTGAPFAIDWERERVTWLGLDQPLRWAPFGACAAPHQLARPMPRSPRIFSFLEDGRLLVGGPPVLLLDLERDEATEVRLPWPAEGLTGSLCLSRDGEALLGLRLGLPLRIPLDGSRPVPFASPGSQVAGTALWHPRADVVLLAREGGGEVRDARRELLRLPRDARPLGWTPDGRGLIVVRGTASREGHLELWTPGGARP